MFSYNNKNLITNEDNKITTKPLYCYEPPTYQGSNPEYIVRRANGSLLSLKEYQRIILPRFNKTFPPSDPDKRTLRQQKRMDDNEVLEIITELNKAGYKTVAIPKTLYDLFYIYYSITEKIERNKQQNQTNSEHEISSNVLHVNDEDIYKTFKKRDQNPLQQKHDLALNNNIITFLQDQQVNLHKICWNDIKKITTVLLNGLMNSLKKKKDYSSFSELSYRIIKILQDQSKYMLFKKTLMNALAHEFYLDPAYYTIYRTATPERNHVYHDEELYSISFGHSVLAALEYDGPSGSVLGILMHRCETLPVFACDVKKSDYQNPKTLTSNLLFIPPAKRINRMTIEGEFGHARGKVLVSEERYISGICGEASTKLTNKDISHPILIKPGFFQNKEDFKNQSDAFLDQNLLHLKSKRHLTNDHLTNQDPAQKRLCEEPRRLRSHREQGYRLK